MLCSTPVSGDNVSYSKQALLSLQGACDSDTKEILRVTLAPMFKKLTFVILLIAT